MDIFFLGFYGNSLLVFLQLFSPHSLCLIYWLFFIYVTSKVSELGPFSSLRVIIAFRVISLGSMTKKNHDYFLVSNQIAYEDQISLISCLYSQLCVLQLHLHIAEASQLNIYTTLIFIFLQTCLFSVFNMSLSVQPVAKSQSKTNPPPVWDSLDFFLSFIPPSTTHKIRKMYWF